MLPIGNITPAVPAGWMSETRGRETISAFGAIVRDPTLTPELKTLWCLYRSYDGKGKGAWPGDETLAQHMGKSARSVQGYRAELLSRGYLEQEKRGPRPAIYRAVVPAASAAPAAAPSENRWEEYLVCDQEGAVRALEQMYRLFRFNGGWDGVPGEMADTWGPVWEMIEWDRLNKLIRAQRDEYGWTAWRAEMHRQLAAIVPSQNGNGAGVPTGPDAARRRRGFG